MGTSGKLSVKSVIIGTIIIGLCIPFYSLSSWWSVRRSTASAIPDILDQTAAAYIASQKVIISDSPKKVKESKKISINEEISVTEVSNTETSLVQEATGSSPATSSTITPAQVPVQTSASAIIPATVPTQTPIQTVTQTQLPTQVQTSTPSQQIAQQTQVTTSTPIVTPIQTPATTSTPVPTPVPTPKPTPPPVTTPSSALKWGIYTGDGANALKDFETMVGKQANIQAVFSGFNSDGFPTNLSSTVGQKGKTLVVYWEPSYGYDKIINGSTDAIIKQFAAGAKSYSYPVILAPFDEMNLNETDWGYGINGNTAAKFVTAWKHIHDLFIDAPNVKFMIAYNNVSIPNTTGNTFKDYYPGDTYVDYVGIDGFNFGRPWQTFAQVFDNAVGTAQTFGKPIFIASMASVAGNAKAEWITEGLGTHIKTYQNLVGWIWFNQNNALSADGGGTENWLVNSDPASLVAFKAILP